MNTTTIEATIPITTDATPATNATDNPLPNPEPAPTEPSPAQITANQCNARKSTGPRSLRGRTRAKMNAVRHGLLGREVLLPGPLTRENRREFRNLETRFWKCLAPVGPVEEMLVDQIVTAHWRLRRTMKAESGEIALSVENGRRLRVLRVEARQRSSSSTDPTEEPVHRTSFGNRAMLKDLQAIREVLERQGVDLTPDGKYIFDRSLSALTPQWWDLCKRLQENPANLDPAALATSQKTQALAWLDEKIAPIRAALAACEEREKEEEAHHQAAALLPSPEAISKILKYERMLERKVYRAMNQLERLQRIRQGELVPPPVSVTMDSDKD